jgi:ribonuclease BN (tRNA processing enzyme)
MNVTLLGTGGPRPDPTRQGPATLVNVAGLNLLFDAGRGVATQLARAGVAVTDLDAVFITHHHFDHIGGLGDLLMASWNNGRTDTLPVFGPLGTEAIIEAMLGQVYARDIGFRIAEEWALGRPLDHPRSLLAVSEVISRTIDLDHGVTVVVDQVEHGGIALDLDLSEWCTVGYRVSAGGRIVTISGDAVASLGLLRLATGADALVMCAYLAEDEITSPDDDFLVTDVLAGAPQAAAFASEAGVAKLILTHIREKSDDAVKQMHSQVAAAFGGEVIVADDLTTVSV